ncbi:ERF family protein [Dyadobacter sp. CY327]|uniref:ERF family protein n=1 Tax=Dyadobacter sp. CY327 TaxID=2907301 RepID=UPI001F2E1969|nr:ERF family protein [Dyadobacter sp. CY327]MCE7073673.1 ERF family protein [Dyadobacter sp. CY327]
METTKGLMEALLKAQLALSNPIKSATNPHFKSKYATLPDIRDMVTPILAEFGLFITQPVQVTDLGAALQTLIVHPESEGYLQSMMPLMLEKQTPQGMGSAITYARRYALCSILNIAADEDDDGNSASAGKPSKPEKAIDLSGRMADNPDIQDDLKANGYDAKAVYDTVIFELNACQDSDMLAEWVKVNKETRRMQGLPSGLKQDVTNRFNAMRDHFSTKPPQGL